MTVIVAGGMGVVGYSQAAGAAPQPSVSQVQGTVNKLQSQMDQVGAQLDEATTQLNQAKSKLYSVQQKESSAEKQFLQARSQLSNVAVATYEDQGQSSVAGLLSTATPDAVLQEAGLMQEIGHMHAQQADRFLGAAEAVANAQAQFRRTEQGIAQIQTNLQAKKEQLNADYKKSQTELQGLSQAALNSITVIGGAGSYAGSCTVHSTPFPVPTTAGEKAVNFAFQQQCTPYQWGGTGPDFDCSGLTQAAWAAAGVFIPRDTYSQFAAYPQVSRANLQPGDLLFFESLGHVGLYIGGSQHLMIDAPATGQVVYVHSLDDSWYSANYVGAVRP